MVTSLGCHQSTLSLIYAVNSLRCHQSLLSPPYFFTSLCYYLSTLSPVYNVTTQHCHHSMLSPLIIVTTLMLSPVYDIINRCFNPVTVDGLCSQQLLCLLLSVCLFVFSLSETLLHLTRPALRSLLSVCSLEWALCPGVLARQ